MTDLAQLKIEVDARSAEHGTLTLKELAKASVAVEAATSTLAKTSKSASEVILETQRRTLQFISATKRLGLMEQSRDIYDHNARTKQVNAEQAQEVSLYRLRATAEYKQSLMEQSRDLYEYNSRANAMRRDQAMLEKRDLEQRNMNYAAAMAERRAQEQLGADIVAIRKRQLVQEGIAKVPDSHLFSNVPIAPPKEDIYGMAGIKSPTQHIQNIDMITRSQQALRMEYAAGNVTGTMYGHMMDELNGKMNLAVAGNTRARGEFRKMASAMASLTFELTGAIYGLATVGGILGAPALYGTKMLKEVQDSQAGITGILVSMGKIDGQALSIGDAWKVAGSYIQSVREDSLRLGVDMGKLVEVNRAIMAPGLAKGLDLTQLKQLATEGTIAVSMLGLNSTQYVQEVRDLIQGGIQPASSTLATALGITDKILKSWHDQGPTIFFKNLNAHMEGFQATAEKIRTSTLSGAWETMATKFAAMMGDPQAFNGLVNAINAVSGALNSDGFKAGVERYWTFVKGVGAVIGDTVSFIYRHADAIKYLSLVYIGAKVGVVALNLANGALLAGSNLLATTMARLGGTATVAAAAESTVVVAQAEIAATAATATVAVNGVSGALLRFAAIGASVAAIASGIGIIGLVLFGAVTIADYLGWFDTLDDRINKLKANIASMPIKTLEAEYAGAQAQILELQVAKQKQTERYGDGLLGTLQNNIINDTTGKLIEAKRVQDVLAEQLDAARIEQSKNEYMQKNITANPAAADAGKGKVDTVLAQETRKRIDAIADEQVALGALNKTQTEGFRTFLTNQLALKGSAAEIANGTDKIREHTDAILADAKAVADAAQFQTQYGTALQERIGAALDGEKRLTEVQKLRIGLVRAGVNTNSSTAIDLAGYAELLDAINANNDAVKQAANWQIDSAKMVADSWKEAGDIIKNSLTTAFGEAGVSLGGMLGAFTAAQATMASAEKDRLDTIAKYTDASGAIDPLRKSAIEQAASEKTANATRKMYGDMAGSAKGFFSSQSKEYQTLQRIEQGFRAYELAMSVKAMVVKATETTTTVGLNGVKTSSNLMAGASAMFASLGPLGFPAVAAMLAVMAGFGARGNGGASSGISAQQQQDRQGTGTVLGDTVNAQGYGQTKSNSLAKSLEIMNKNSFELLDYNNGMLVALRNIDKNIGNLGAAVAKQLGVSFNTSGLGLGSIMSRAATNLGGGFAASLISPTSGLGKLANKVGNALFGGNSSTNLYDQGINLSKQTVGAASRGVTGSIYQTTQTNTSGGLFRGDSTSYNTYTKQLNDEITRTMTLTIASMRSAVLESATALGIGGARALIDGMMLDIGNISLMGLSGSQIADALNGVMSKAFDQMATAILPSVKDFQQVGEGAGQTLVRLVNDYQSVDFAMRESGKTFGMVGVESIAMRESLIALSGGLDSFISKADYFSKNFLTSAEQYNILRTSVTTEMSRLGYAGVTTKVQFKQLVQGLDVSTDAGAQTYASLMNVAKAFDQMTQMSNQLNDSMTNLATTGFANVYDYERYKAMGRNGSLGQGDASVYTRSGAITTTANGIKFAPNGSGDMSALIAEIAAMRKELQAAQISQISAAKTTENVLVKWENDGMPSVRTVAA